MDRTRRWRSCARSSLPACLLCYISSSSRVRWSVSSITLSVIDPVLTAEEAHFVSEFVLRSDDHLHVVVNLELALRVEPALLAEFVDEFARPLFDAGALVLASEAANEDAELLAGD